MNCEVYNRFREVIPIERLDDLTHDEVTTNCKVAFEVIGYKPNNLKESIKKVEESSTALSLFEFIYEVYEVDSNGD